MKYNLIAALLFWILSGTNHVLAQDTSAPLIIQQQPAGNTVEISGPTTFSGSVSDTGGAGIDKALFLLRNLNTNDWVDIDGTVDSDRIFRDVPLILANADAGTWSITTNLPARRYRLFIAVRDNARNAEYWGVRTTTDIVNAPVLVEYEVNNQNLPSGTWYYRVIANSGSFYQVANNQENEGGGRYPGIRKFTVP